MRIEVTVGDVKEAAGDVLALKYAQSRHGVDAEVATRFWRDGHTDDEISPEPDQFIFVKSPHGIAAAEVLFLGVERLLKFGYEQIRVFGREMLAILARERPQSRALITTVHGPGYGLDEAEAFGSLIAGFVDACRAGDVPADLELVSIFERDAGRAQRLRSELLRLLPNGALGPTKRPNHAV
ncbi:MAG: hypothetical protein ABW061_06145, partial [Polyangiaceae bacterium]